MGTTLKALAEFGITAVTITGLIVYLGRKIFEHYLSLKIDSYKNDLVRANYEYQTKFSKLYNDRAEFIKDLFSDFTELEKLINSVTTTWQGAEWLNSHEREDKAKEFLEQTKAKFEKNKIYFTKQLCNEIENALEVSKLFILESLKVKRQSNLEKKDREFYLEKEKQGETAFRQWLKLEEESQKELLKIRESLADKFRSLFGVK